MTSSELANTVSTEGIVHCPSCGKAFQNDGSITSLKVKCNQCNTVFSWPQKDATPTPAGTAGNPRWYRQSNSGRFRTSNRLTELPNCFGCSSVFPSLSPVPRFGGSSTAVQLEPVFPQFGEIHSKEAIHVHHVACRVQLPLVQPPFCHESQFTRSCRPMPELQTAGPTRSRSKSAEIQSDETRLPTWRTFGDADHASARDLVRADCTK